MKIPAECFLAHKSIVRRCNPQSSNNEDLVAIERAKLSKLALIYGYDRNLGHELILHCSFCHQIYS